MHDTAAVWTLTLATDRAWVVTLYQTLLSFPLFLLALPSGALADILDKRRFLILVQIIGALVAAVMAVLGLLGALYPSVILAGAFLMGCAMAFGLPAWQAMIPEVVEKPMLPSAITLGGVGINVSRAVGPFLGGYLVADQGAAPVFAINAVSFLGLALALAFWRRPQPAAKPHAETVMSAMIAAVRHVRYSRPIQRVYIRHGLFAFAAFAPVALLPLIVVDLGLPARTFGLLMGVYGLGGITAALVILPQMRRLLSLDQVTTMAGVLALVAIALLPLARTLPTLAAVLLVAGGAWLISMSQLSFAGQSVFPHWVRARASAIQLLCVQGMIAIGSLLWGIVTDKYGLSISLWAASATLLIYLVASLRLRVDRALSSDLTPSPSDHQHTDLIIEPAPESGPVRISVHYEILPENEPEFFGAIAMLRDSRLRDGAYRWHLWRDLAKPNHISEVFLVGSWEEHLRQSDRATASSQKIESRVLQYHQGAQAPEVRHSLHLEPGTSDCPVC